MPTRDVCMTHTFAWAHGCPPYDDVRPFLRERIDHPAIADHDEQLAFTAGRHRCRIRFRIGFDFWICFQESSVPLLDRPVIMSLSGKGEQKQRSKRGRNLGYLVVS